MYIGFVLFILSTHNSFTQENIDLLILDNNYDGALQEIDKVLQNSETANLYFKKGMVYNKLQMYSDAIVALEKANKLDQSNIEILDELAETHSILGNYIDAIQYYSAALKIQPDNLVLAGKLGRNYINLKNYTKAYQIFDKIYKTDTSNVYWNKQYAYCAYQKKELLKAADLYEEVLAANPRDYSSYLNLIRLYRQLPPSGKIEPTIKRAMESFPDDPGLTEELADYFFTSKQYAKAQAAYEEYFTCGGDSVFNALLNYGISLYFERYGVKSISILSICANQVANDPYALFYLSLNHKRLANYELSEAYMNAAIESATPSYLPEMYHHLGQILGQQRKFEESILALKEANKQDPTNHEVLFEIATTYEEYNSNKTLALNYYQIYLQQAGGSAKNQSYAQNRIDRIKEDMFFDE